MQNTHAIKNVSKFNKKTPKKQPLSLRQQDSITGIYRKDLHILQSNASNFFLCL